MSRDRWSTDKARKRIAQHGSEPAFAALATGVERTRVSLDDIARRRKQKALETEKRKKVRAARKIARERLAQRQREAEQRRKQAAKQRPAHVGEKKGLRARRDFPACMIGLEYWLKKGRGVSVLDADRDFVLYADAGKQKRATLSSFLELIE